MRQFGGRFWGIRVHPEMVSIRASFKSMIQNLRKAAVIH